MQVDGTVSNHDGLPTGGGRFSWPLLGVWLIGAALLGGIAAWGAVTVQGFFAPLVLFPLIVGVLLGAMLVGLLRAAQVGNRPTLWTGAILAAAVAVAGQHYLSYRDAVHRYEKEDAELVHKARTLFPDQFKDRVPEPPSSFAEYMRRQAKDGRPLFRARGGTPVNASGLAAWASWTLDALLGLIAAVAVMIPALRQPFCNRCGTWYRTVRAGRIAPALAQRVAETAALILGQQVKSARYRISNCSAGCGPTRLELSWEDRDGKTFLSTAWLQSEPRDQVTKALDDVS